MSGELMPEKIWAWYFSESMRNQYISGGWHDAYEREDVEYTRTAAIPNAAYVAGLEGALSSIAKEKFYPMGIGIEPEYTREAKLAQAALASRPASPDVRVVTVEKLAARLWQCQLEGGGSTPKAISMRTPDQFAEESEQTRSQFIRYAAAAIEAIIAGQP